MVGSSTEDKRLSKPHTKGTIIGLFRRSAKGFGFVRPHTSKEKSDQIYIPSDESRDASSGDEVAVKITKRPKGPGMNVEGRIVQVLARASGIFVGTYFEELGAGFVAARGRHHVWRTDLCRGSREPRGPSRPTRSRSRWFPTRPLMRRGRG